MFGEPSAGRRGVVLVARGLVAVVIALVALGALGASPAAAHATLLETTPADDTVVDAVPETVELRYSEPVEVGEEGTQALSPDGVRVDSGGAELLEGGEVVAVPIDDGGEGTYTVAWRVTSEDGHTITGSFVFHVGTETGGVEIDDSTPWRVEVAGFVGRWFAFAGSLVVLGAAIVTWLASGDEAVSRRMRQLGLLAAAAALVGAVIALVALAAEATGRDLVDGIGQVGDFVSDQRTGRLAALRAGLLGAVLLAVVPLRNRMAAAVSALGVVGSMVVVSLAGHAWTTTPKALTVVTDVIHQVAVGVWLGGVVALLRVLHIAADRTGLARRFSGLALVTVVVVAVTGSISAWAQIRGWDALVDTSFGRLVLAKVAGFVVLVVLGWLNRSRLIALLEQSVAPLARSLMGETAVAVVVVGLTAGLVSVQPARLATSEDSGPYETTLEEGQMSLDIQVDPAQTGANDLHLFFYQADGTTPATVLAVEITAKTGDLPPRKLDVTPVTSTHVSALDASLSSPGSWTIEVIAVDAEGASTTFSLEVPIR